MTGPQAGTVIRHPKRGKAHRPVLLHRWPRNSTTELARACDPWLPSHGYETVPLAQCAPEDLCKRCFPRPEVPS